MIDEHGLTLLENELQSIESICIENKKKEAKRKGYDKSPFNSQHHPNE